VHLAADEVSDEVANSLIDKRLARKDTARGFILDGYPVTAGQADFLEKILKDRGLPMPVVLHLQISDSVATERMKVRGRSDDKPELMQIRLNEYHKQSGALLARYGASQIKTVNAGQNIDQVWREIEKGLATN
jgi:adenylate kinase